MAAFLSGWAAEAQNPSNDLVRPGDILIVKVLPPPLLVGNRVLRGTKSWVSKTVFVRSDGTMTPPRFQGIAPTGDIKVESLRLVEVSQRLQESYQAVAPGRRFEVVIERAIFNQLLN